MSCRAPQAKYSGAEILHQIEEKNEKS